MFDYVGAVEEFFEKGHVTQFVLAVRYPIPVDVTIQAFEIPVCAFVGKDGVEAAVNCLFAKFAFGFDIGAGCYTDV